MRRLCRAKCRQDRSDDQGQKNPEVGQDLADVVAAAAKYGEEGVADSAFERGSRQAAVGFHVTDFSFDRAAASQIGQQFWCQAAPCTTDQHAGLQHIVASIPAVDDGDVGALVGQDIDLLQRRARVWPS